MKKSLRIVMFTCIILVCIFTIVFVIYDQFFKDKGSENENVQTPAEAQVALLEENFNNIFTNKLETQGYEVNITGITKLNSSENLVYTWVNKEKNVDNKYELNLNIPRVNISSTSAEKFNNKIKEIYVGKANSIIINANKSNTQANTNTANTISNTLNGQNTTTNSINAVNTNTIENDDISNTTIYTVEYQSYINTNILSLVIKSTLKEPGEPQRVMVQTFNYNLSTNEEITFNSILEIKGLDKDIVNNAIKTKVEQQKTKTESLKNLGYSVYERDLTSDIYNADKVTNFLLGEDNHLYIIYAYGNSNYTDEMDVIAFI